VFFLKFILPSRPHSLQTYPFYDPESLRHPTSRFLTPLKVRKIGRHHSPYGSYREIGWLHYTVVGLLLAGVGVAAAQIITIEQINEKMRTYDIETGDLTSIENLERTSGGIAMMSGAVMLFTFIFWCIWKNKSTKNAWLFYSRSGVRGIGTSEPQTPGWAVGFYFIPIVQFWKPFQAMAFIRDQVSAQVKTGLLLGFWWTAWLIWTIYSRVANKFNDSVDTIEGVIAHNEQAQVGALILIVTSPLAAAVIHQLSMGQKRAAKAMADEAARPPIDPSIENGWKHALPPV
jgi:hypothetical protein